MVAALANDLDYTQLRLTARLERDGVNLRLPVSVRSVGGLQGGAGERFATGLDYKVAQRSASLDVLDVVSKSVVLNQDAAQHEVYLKEGLHLTAALTPKAGLASIRLVVMDRSSGALGTLSIPVSAIQEGNTAPAGVAKTRGDITQIPPPASGSGAAAPPATSNSNTSRASGEERPEPEVAAGEAANRDPLLQRASEASLEFVSALPDYICRELIQRSINVTKGTSWRRIDTIEADLVFENGKEDYRNISISGTPVNRPMEELKGARSTGEFATLMRMLFLPSTKADFHFVKTARTAGVETREYSFSVRQERSRWIVHTKGQSYYLGYAGRVWIDPSSARVLRIEMKASALPPDLGLDKVETSAEYEYRLIAGSGRYLLPARAMLLSCRTGGFFCERNRIEFRNYRKFEAESGIRYETNP
jgi:hypothetical protein